MQHAPRFTIAMLPDFKPNDFDKCYCCYMEGDGCCEVCKVAIDVLKVVDEITALPEGHPKRPASVEAIRNCSFLGDSSSYVARAFKALKDAQLKVDALATGGGRATAPHV
jgi:hypothetical protein